MSISDIGTLLLKVVRAFLGSTTWETTHKNDIAINGQCNISIYLSKEGILCYQNRFFLISNIMDQEILKMHANEIGPVSNHSVFTVIKHMQYICHIEDLKL